MRPFLKTLLFAGLLMAARALYAQETAFADVSIKGMSTDKELAPDGFGNTLVWGTFDHIGGKYKGRLLRLTPDGIPDPSFKPLFADFYILDVVPLPDGKLLVRTRLTTVNGVLVKDLIRLNHDGSFDDTFDAAVDPIHQMHVQSDGKIIVVESKNVVTPESVYRLNADGTLDATFSFDGRVMGNARMVIGPGDEIYYEEEGRIHKFNPDGSIDDSFYTGTGVEGGHIQTLAPQPDGKLIIGGMFTGYNGIERNSILRLNPDGQVDMSFDAGNGPNWVITSIVTRSNGNILVAGPFRKFNDQATGLLELTDDGSIYKVIGTTPDAHNIWSVFEGPDEKITCSGSFFEINSVPRFGVARFNPDYSLDETFVPQISENQTGVFEVRPDGSVVLASGESVSGVQTGERFYPGLVAELNSDGGLNDAFNPPIPADAAHYVYQILLQPDGKVILGGVVTRWNAPTLMRLNTDGTVDNTFAIGTGPTANSYSQLPTALAEHDGLIYVGGPFTQFNGTPTTSLVALNQDGSIAKTFHLPASSQVLDIDFQSDGKILVMGYFNFPTGMLGLVRLSPDGNLDNTFTVAVSGQPLEAIAVDKNDRIYVAGSPIVVDGVTTWNDIIRLTPAGELDTSFDTSDAFPGNASAQIKLLVLPNNDLAVGGYFHVYQYEHSPGFILLDSTAKRIPTTPSFGSFSSVSDLAFSNGSIYLCGRLLSPNYTSVRALAKIAVDSVRAPGQLSIAVQKTGVFEMTWADMSSNEAGFVLERSDNGTNFLPIDTVDMNVSSATDNNIVAFRKYFYRVRAFDNMMSSEYSNTVSAVWESAPSGSLNLSIAQAAPAHFVLSWSGEVIHHSGFIIEKRSGANDFVPIDTVDASTANASITENGNGIFSYRIEAFNSQGRIYSNIVSAPLAPAGAIALEITFVETEKYLLSWSGSIANQYGFYVQHKTGDQPFESIDSVSAETFDLVVREVDSQPDLYRVVAYNASGEVYSNEVTIAEPFPSGTLTLSIAQSAPRRFILLWSGEVVNHHGFVVQKSVDNGDFLPIDTVDISISETAIVEEKDASLRYRVAAFNSVGQIYSNAVSAPLKPMGVLTLQVMLIQPGEYALAWSGNIVNQYGFYVQHKTGDQPFESIDSVSAGTFDFTVTDLDGHPDLYRIVAYNPNGKIFSNEVMPSAPSGELILAAEQPARREFRLAWFSNMKDYLGFIIERSQTHIHFAAVDTVSADTYSYTDFVKDDHAYYYRIAAYNTFGKIYSNEATVPAGGKIESFPVPASGSVLTVQVLHEAGNGIWRLLTTEGVVVPLTYEATQDVLTIDISTLQAGIYILQYIAGQKLYASKIIKE